MNKISLMLCVTIVICAVGHIDASPLLKRNEAAETQNCKDLCNLCNCVGFYCGDECICECNNKDDENVNCVEDMQNNCQKSNIPYEVLIQGPTGSRFVRSLLTEDSVAQKAMDPKKRSTISIFKPDEVESVRKFKRDVEEKAAAKDETESADKIKSEEPAKVDDVKPKEVEKHATDKPEDITATMDELAKECECEDVKLNEDKSKRDVEKVEEKEAAQTDADEKPKTDDKPKADEKDATSEAETAPQENTEQSEAETDKPAESEKKVQKRGINDELQDGLGEVLSGDVNAKIAVDEPAQKTDDKKDEPTVGLALPGVLPVLPGLLALKAKVATLPALAPLAALKAQLDVKKVAAGAKLLPLKAKIDAIKAKAGLALPLLPIV